MARVSYVSVASIAWMVVGGLDLVGARLPLRRMAAPGSSFDRQYVVPTPSSSDSKIDWWWANAQANGGVDGNPPANIQVVFFMGNIFPPQSDDAPEFHVDLDGLFPDGSPFHFSLPATIGTVTSEGEQALGTWDSVGSFVSTPGESFHITFSNADVQGTIVIEDNGPPNHFACNTTTSPLFAAVAPASLSANDDALFNHLGWAVAAPAGSATVSLTVDGTLLDFSGTGYHDQNFIDSDTLFASFITEWFFGTAQVGPYVFSYLKTRTFESEWTLTTGFLARDGVVLQNQCLVVPTGSAPAVQAADSSRLSRFGVIHSDVSGVDVPLTYVVDYVLANGEQFRFNLTETAEVLDLPFYHRSIGPVSGGKVGDDAQEGVVLFEWLNPGENVYVP